MGFREAANLVENNLFIYNPLRKFLIELKENVKFSCHPYYIELKGGYNI